MKHHLIAAAAAAIMAAALGAPASAQKAKDTLRIPLKFPIDFVSYTYSGNIVETQLSTLAVFDTATREVARAEADGSRGYWIQTAHATAPADARTGPTEPCSSPVRRADPTPTRGAGLSPPVTPATVLRWHRPAAPL